MPQERLPDPVSAPSFDAAWEAAQQIPGWLTQAQARLLFSCAAELQPGWTVLEIGSHQGRSTVVLGAVAAAQNGRLVAVDPFVEGRLFGGLPTRERFLRNISSQGLDDVVDLVETYSTELRPTWRVPLDLLYIDGKHDYWTVSDDLRWTTHLPVGGRFLMHDCFSSIGVTLAVLRHVLFSRELRFERREGSLGLFVRSPPGVRDRVRIVVQLPWWLRNVAIKLMLRLRLRWMARLVGHTSPYDPY